jgi:CheY-like chemotaxis protein
MTRLQVLLVEDDGVVAMLLEHVLSSMGHDVCATEVTEADAVAAAARHRPDLMIVDSRLAEGSGVGAVDGVLRERFVPHVFVSGDALAVRALRPRAVVIEKPFNERELAQAIGLALAVPTSA